MKSTTTKKWTSIILAVLLTLTSFMSMTACSVQGTSSAASQTPADSSKTEVMSSASASSAEPIKYMSYDEYFSEQREITPYEYFRKDGDNYLYDGDTLLFPIQPGGRSGDRCYAQTKTGMLFLEGNDVYLITKANRKAKMIYSGDRDKPFRPDFLSAKADEYVFFTIDRWDYYDTFEISRVFRPTGQTDVVATSDDIQGRAYYLEPYTNSMVLVYSEFPYEKNPDWTEQEAENAARAAQRLTLVNMETGEMFCDKDDEDAFYAAMEKYT